MLKKFLAFLRKSKEQNDKAAYEAGYDWAAGFILRGVQEGVQVARAHQAHVLAMATEGQPFDRGATDAVYDLQLLLPQYFPDQTIP